MGVCPGIRKRASKEELSSMLDPPGGAHIAFYVGDR
jgi:hypothetical protein